MIIIYNYSILYCIILIILYIIIIYNCSPLHLLPLVSGKTVARRGRAEPTEDAEGREVLQVSRETHPQISQQRV